MAGAPAPCVVLPLTSTTEKRDPAAAILPTALTTKEAPEPAYLDAKN